MRVDSLLLQPGTKKGREVGETLSKMTWQDLAEQQCNQYQLEWPRCGYQGAVFRCEEIPSDSETL